MIKYITNDFVITEFWNLPYGGLFRYQKQWCIKTHANRYRRAHEHWAHGCSVHHTIPIDALIATELP